MRVMTPWAAAKSSIAEEPQETPGLGGPPKQ